MACLVHINSKGADETAQMQLRKCNCAVSSEHSLVPIATSAKILYAGLIVFHFCFQSVSSKVSFRSPTNNTSSSSSVTYQMDPESKQRQRMLGYDWIAALIDNDSNAVNQSETFFDELREFRRTNLQECVNQMYME